VNADAQRQAITVAERLLQTEAILTAVSAEAAASLAHGLAGTALLHARMSILDGTFEKAAVEHWAEAARQAQHVRTGHAGTYHAPGGLAASLIIGTPYLPDPDTHRAATLRATRWISSHAVSLADHHRAYLDAGGIGTPWHVYDVITGMAGVGRVLLAAMQSGLNDAEPGLLAALDILTGMINTSHGERPGWWLAQDSHPNAVDTHPSGAANTGMAHGVAGPLALLSVARLAGYSITGQDDAIEQAAIWLLRWRTRDDAIWPSHVTGDELDRGMPPQMRGRGDAWCYGIPGISRALTLAGQTIGQPHLKEAANDAVTSLALRPGQWDVDGPTLCHGHAGVLSCVADISIEVAEHAAVAVESAFNPTHRFAFRHTEGGVAVDQPGFLTGAAGTALALAAYGALPSSNVDTSWDALLLLS
jgi:class I lanthipeptide synthase